VRSHCQLSTQHKQQLTGNPLWQPVLLTTTTRASGTTLAVHTANSTSTPTSTRPTRSVKSKSNSPNLQRWRPSRWRQLTATVNDGAVRGVHLSTTRLKHRPTICIEAKCRGQYIHARQRQKCTRLRMSAQGARSSDYVTHSTRRRCRQNGQKLETWCIATQSVQWRRQSRTSTQELTILYTMHRVMQLPHLTGHVPISGRTWRRRFWTNSKRNEGDPAVLRRYRR